MGDKEDPEKLKQKNRIGAYTFLIGAIIAVLFGIFGVITPTIT